MSYRLQSRYWKILFLLQAPGENAFLASSNFQKLPAFLVLWSYPLNLMLPFSHVLLLILISCIPFIRTLMIIFRAHQDNPGKFPHPKILNKKKKKKKRFLIIFVKSLLPHKGRFTGARNQDVDISKEPLLILSQAPRPPITEYSLN